LPHHRIDQRRRASFHRGDGGGDCEVRWIVETAGSDGINYAGIVGAVFLYFVTDGLLWLEGYVRN
jgi:hypothetical protein